uniref:Uncharacterized protein n=1 Tax=Callorhinchus milii TaxID=7868 RepID=A0A4W3GC45_CALMI
MEAPSVELPLLRPFGCEYSLLSRPDGSACFTQGGAPSASGGGWGGLWGFFKIIFIVTRKTVTQEP